MTTPPGAAPPAPEPAPSTHPSPAGGHDRTPAVHGHGAAVTAVPADREAIPERTQNRLERNRWTIIGLVVAVQVLAIVVSIQLSAAEFLVNDAIFAVHAAEVVAVALYVIIAIVALGLWRAGRRKSAVRLLGLYLGVLTAQLAVYVLLLLVGMGGRSQEMLLYLGDLVSCLALMITIFTTWYWIIDAMTPGGAFLFASRPGKHEEPRLIDYLFLAFNTTLTFGPTTEALVDARAKVAMMLQTGLSVAVLVVLASRIVARS